MGDGIVPAEYWELQPPWKNFFENSAAVQFNHRLLAMTTFTSVTALWAWSRKILLPRRVRFATNLLFAVASLQVLLGISTLVYLVPVHLAAMHQAGSLTLLTVVSWLLHELGKVKAVPR
jgi:cytochrome c oxidase assembly protein subunit 15